MAYNVLSLKNELNPKRRFLISATFMKYATAMQHNGVKIILNNELIIAAFPLDVFDSNMTFCVSSFHDFLRFLSLQRFWYKILPLNIEFLFNERSGSTAVDLNPLISSLCRDAFFCSTMINARSWSVCNFFNFGHHPADRRIIDVGTKMNLMSKISLFDVWKSKSNSLKHS